MGSENSKEVNANEYNYTEIFKKYSPYRVLGVSESDSIDVIVKRYRFLCKTHHPDKGGDIKKFNLIKEAFTQVNLLHENREFHHEKVKQKFKKDLSNLDEGMHPVFHKNQEPKEIAKESQKTSGNSNKERLQPKPISDRCKSTNFDEQKTCDNKIYYDDESDFIKKFNQKFEKNYLPSENQSYGYANIDWSKYDNNANNKKYEIIPYEMIHFNYSNNVNCEQFDTNISDYSKYPTINDKDLNYTDFMQAYTNCSTLLPDDHEVIWNQYFKDYHNRDMKKVETQRDEKPVLSEQEMYLQRRRVEESEMNEKDRISSWNNWVEKQKEHYMKSNTVAINNN